MKNRSLEMIKVFKVKMDTRIIATLCVFVILFLTGCKKWVETDPPITSVTGKNVYNDDATAVSVLTGIYANMGSGNANYTGLNGIALRSGLSSDELTLYPGGFDGQDLQRLYQNNLLAQIPLVLSPWQEYYQNLLVINSAIEGLQASTSLTAALKKQLLGEALFVRAFFHLYLVNFYGDVPLAMTSDWRINAVAHRTPIDQVYKQIIADLKEAQSLLNDQYLKNDGLTPYSAGSEVRVRPTKWAATALLARVYLYTREWANAEEQATIVINGSSLYALNVLDAAFTKNNVEAIWQIQYTNSDWGTEGYHFILTEDPGYARPTFLSSFLLNDFEPGDNRKVKWVGSIDNGTDTFYFPFKYKAQTSPNNSEYFMVLRLAELFLIRAEATAHLNKLSESIADLDKIRERAGLPLIAVTNPGIGQSTLLDAILHERQVELFAEWGHRWFDLKRTGTIDAVMAAVLPVKRPGFSWNTNWQLYPISASDIQLNHNLAPNNPGY